MNQTNAMNEHFNDFIDYIFIVLIFGIALAVIFANDYFLATTGYSLSESDTSVKVGYYVGMLATAAWSYFLLNKLKNRKNWARILLALGSLLVLFTAPNAAKVTFKINIIWGVVFVINFLLQFYILYLSYFDEVVSTSFKPHGLMSASTNKSVGQTVLNNGIHGNFTDELTRLHSLHQSGALSEEEYEAAKAIVLKK